MKNTQDMLADYFFDQARWRWEKAGEHPEDSRNEVTAKELSELADWLRTLPDDHPDIMAIRTLHGPGGWEVDAILPGEEASRLASRFGGFDTHQSPEAFLHEFVDAFIAEEMAGLDDEENR
jgi:hypothetical protein